LRIVKIAADVAKARALLRDLVRRPNEASNLVALLENVREKNATDAAGRDQVLVEEARKVSDPLQRPGFAARIATQIYQSQLPVEDLLRGAGMLAPGASRRGGEGRLPAV